MTRNNRNLQQETDSATGGGPLKIGLVKTRFQSGRTEQLENDATTSLLETSCGMESKCSHDMRFFEQLILCGLNLRIQATRVRFSPGIRGLLGIVLATLVFAIAGSDVSAQAEGSENSLTRTTVVVFADRPMQDNQWNTLFAALRTSEREATTETRTITDNFVIVRGDRVQPGMSVDRAIVVHLHGDCTLVLLARRTAYGVPLGWVRKVQGRIEPFVHVDCTRIGQVLGPQARGLDADGRDDLMAGAIARVIAHEWIHIATQSSAHTESGIEKAAYGVADLMARKGDEPLIHRRRLLRPPGE